MTLNASEVRSTYALWRGCGYAIREKAMSNTIHYYLSLRVGTQWYGIPVEAVAEVHHMVLLTELPVPVPHVIGVMTLHDVACPVVDLRLLFGISVPQYRLDTPIIVFRSPAGIVGLIADEAHNVEPIPEAQIVHPEGIALPYVLGVARLQDRRLLLLDTRLFAEAIAALPVRIE